MSGDLYSARTVPPGAAAILALIVAALAFGAAIAQLPWLTLVAVLALSVCAFGAFGLGSEALILTLLVLVPLVPATDAGVVAGIGSQGLAVRAPIIGLLLLAAMAVYFGGVPRPARDSVARLVISLLMLAAVGAATAIVNAQTATQTLSELAHAAGQPLVYALALLVFGAYAVHGKAAQERLLIAFCLGIVLQAGFVAVELASGAAFDAVRGFTRAQGTVGSNFLSALGMLGVFAALALRERASDALARRFSDLALVCGAGILAAGISRGAVIALMVGFAYLLFRSRRLRVGPLLAGLAVSAVVVVVLGSFWEQRLQTGITEFDRTSTWVAGLRIAGDNPVTGLGSDGVVEAIETRPDYAVTPYGTTTVIPHNIWILGFAESGVVYLLAMVALTVVAISSVRSRPRPRAPGDGPLVAALVGFGVLCAINNMFGHPELVLGVLMMLALLLVPTGRVEPG